MASISCKQFLDTIFEGYSGQIWLHRHKGDPGNSKEGWKGEGENLKKLNGFDPTGTNAYTAQAVLTDTAPARKVIHAKAVPLIMLDDVKSRKEARALSIKPSYLLETSPGNYQAGFRISDGENLDLARNVLRKCGKVIDGIDPSGNGLVRYIRLPDGINNKEKVVEANKGKPWVCRVVWWNPNNVYTLEQFAKGFNIDLNEEVDFDTSPAGQLSALESDREKVVSCLKHLNSDNFPNDSLGEGWRPADWQTGMNKSEDGRAFWIRVGMAIKSTGLEDAFRIWVNWSKERAGYNEDNDRGHSGRKACVDEWKYMQGTGTIFTIATLYKIAKSTGWNYTGDLEELEPEPEIYVDKQEQYTKDLIAQVENWPPLMQDIYNDILACSYRPQPVYTIFSTVATIAALLGRGVMVGKMAPNIYLTFIGETGCGKDIPLKYPGDICEQLGATCEVVQGVGRGQGLEDAVLDSAWGSVLWINDENRPLSNDISISLSDFESKIYSAVGKTLVPRRLSAATRTASPRTPLRYPFFMKLSASTPNAAFNESSWIRALSGEGSRMLYIMTDTRFPAYNKDVNIIPKVLPQLEDWYNAYAEEWDIFTDNNDYEPLRVHLTSAAKRTTDELGNRADSKVGKHGPIADSMYVRVREYTTRFALIFAQAENARTTKIMSRHVRLGHDLMMAYTQYSLQYMEENVGQYQTKMTGNDTPKVWARIQRILKDKGKGLKVFEKYQDYIKERLIPRRILAMILNMTNKIALDIVRDTLQDQGRIRECWAGRTKNNSIQYAQNREELKDVKGQRIQVWRITK